MDGSQPASESASRLEPVLDLLVSAGYVDAGKPDVSAEDKLIGGLSWCITAAHSEDVSKCAVPANNSDEAQKRIEEALKCMGCPHPLQASQIQGVDCEAVFPVVRWLVCQIQTIPQDQREENIFTEPISGQGDLGFKELEKELQDVEGSVRSLNVDLDKQNQRKVDLLNRSQLLQRRINEIAGPSAQRLISLMKSLKTLEKKESDFQYDSIAKHSKLQAEINELEEKIATATDSKILSDELDHALNESMGKLTSAKRELGSRLRDILSVKRQLDEIPCQSELIQYDLRLMELNAHIQGKLRQTRKYYATYNALLEIKDLMLKETSLLNSISSQFQDAIASPEGRAKLIYSVEGIVKGSQQKLQKVHFRLQEEQKVFDTLKERYAAAILEQRQSCSLLKAFQEEVARNAKLRKQGDS